MNQGLNLSKIRKIRGRKQFDLGKKLGMTQSNYSKYERKQKLSDDFIERAAKELEVAPEDIRQFDEKIIFQIQEVKENNAGGLVFHNLPEKIIELYEARIKAQEEEIKHLRSLLNALNLNGNGPKL